MMVSRRLISTPLVSSVLGSSSASVPAGHPTRPAGASHAKEPTPHGAYANPQDRHWCDLAATVAALTGTGIAAAPSSGAAVGCGVLFDDFNYSSRTDAALGQRGWSIRSNSGGPGVSGARWLADNVSFPTVDGQKVAQLKAVTDGTAGDTSHAEFSQSNRRFFEGTYLARIKFADAPVSGPDGDHVNQTFYTISPLAAPRDPMYSELDFSEYLPNGGWGEPGPINYQTSWYTYVADPWYADN